VGEKIKAVGFIAVPTRAEVCARFNIEAEDLMEISGGVDRLVEVKLRDPHGVRFHRWPAAFFPVDKQRPYLLGFDLTFRKGDAVDLPLLRTGPYMAGDAAELVRKLCDTVDEVRVTARWSQMMELTFKDKDGVVHRGRVTLKDGRAEFRETKPECEKCAG